MKRLVFIISAFLILTGNVGADQTNSSTVDQGALELAFWQTIHKSDDPDMFREYLNQFPEGVFAGLAKLKIKKLGGDTSAPASDSTTTNSSSTASSSGAYVWCATVEKVEFIKTSKCQSKGGQNFSSDKSRAEAEHKRLKGATSSATSTASGDDKVWCVTPKKYFLTNRKDCMSDSGKAFTNKHTAKAEHFRLAHILSYSTSTASSPNSIVWCATKNWYRSQWESDCKSYGGKSYQSEYAAKVEHYRLKGHDPTASSTKIWCATKVDWFKDTASECRSKGGKDFSYNYAGQQKAQAEHRRLAGKSTSSTSTASSSASVAASSGQIYCATKYGVTKTRGDLCLSQNGSPYSTHTRATKEHNRLSGKSYSSNTNTNYSSNTTKKKKKGLLSGLKNLFSGSPFVTVQMSASELRGISDKQLCNTYRMEGFYSGKTPPIINEVNRRGLDCYGAKGKCRAYGFKEGTSGFAGCVMQTEMQLVEEQRKQNKATIDNAISNLNPPAPAPVVICRNTWVYDVHGRQQRIEQCN